MPLYEYHCKQCGEDFEVRQGYEDPPLTEHETCGGMVEKRFSTSTIKFTGSGFYETDYKRKK